MSTETEPARDLALPVDGAKWNLIEVVLVWLAIFLVGWASSYFIDFLFDRFGENWPDNAGMLFSIASIVAEATLLLVALWYVVVVRHHGSLGEIGFTTKGWPRQVVIGLAAGLGIFAIVYAADLVTFLLTGPRVAPSPLVELVQAAGAPRELLLSTLLGSVLVPISEESYFRGFAYPALRDRIGKPWAMVLVTIFYASVHLDPSGLPALLLAGLALVWLYDRTHSIWAPIVAHAVWNGLVVVVAYLV